MRRRLRTRSIRRLSSVVLCAYVLSGVGLGMSPVLLAGMFGSGWFECCALRCACGTTPGACCCSIADDQTDPDARRAQLESLWGEACGGSPLHVHVEQAQANDSHDPLGPSAAPIPCLGTDEFKAAGPSMRWRSPPPFELVSEPVEQALAVVGALVDGPVLDAPEPPPRA